MGKNKSEKINKVLNEENRDLNLHEIKAKTGAGNGYSNTNSLKKDKVNVSDDVFVHTSKYDKIHKVLAHIEGKANLHKIKSETGAGNGYAHKSISASSINNESNEFVTHAHKSHKIHAIFHEHDRKLNLHQIKAKTGAGSGYKHQ